MDLSSLRAGALTGLALLQALLFWLLPAAPACAALPVAIPSPVAPAPVSASRAAPSPAGLALQEDGVSAAYRCDGTALTAILHSGAVDDPTIPNGSAGTLPGAFVQLQWQRAGGLLALQLPRTNNAGLPSFTDGRWWWSPDDPDHPRFRLRRGRGDIQEFTCEPA